MSPKIIIAIVAFVALGLKVLGEALVKDWSKMKPSRVFESDEKKNRRALWAKRGKVFVKVGTTLLLVVAGWAVVSAFLKN